MSGIVVTFFVLLTVAYTVIADDGCGPNEVYRSCGSACTPTCQHPQTAGISCIQVCVRGCFCKPDYIRDERTKKCVRKSQCKS